MEAGSDQAHRRVGRGDARGVVAPTPNEGAEVAPHAGVSLDHQDAQGAVRRLALARHAELDACHQGKEPADDEHGERVFQGLGSRYGEAARRGDRRAGTRLGNRNRIGTMS